MRYQEYVRLLRDAEMLHDIRAYEVLSAIAHALGLDLDDIVSVQVHACQLGVRFGETCARFARYTQKCYTVHIELGGTRCAQML